MELPAQAEEVVVGAVLDEAAISSVVETIGC